MQRSEQLPNIILCLADQLRPFELGCHGHPVVRTPNIDHLAKQGVHFEYGCSNSPLCVPARHVVLTGQSARTCMGTNSNHVGFPPSDVRDRCLDPMLPEVLRDAGYRTGSIGKWHIYPRPDLVGFDEVCIPHNLHRHFGQSFYDKEGHREEIQDFSPDYESNRVRMFLENPDTRPFFLYYNISPPHSPLSDAPRRYLDMYARDQVCLRPNVRQKGKLPYRAEEIRSHQWDYLANLQVNLEGDEAVMTADYQHRIRERPFHGLRRVYRDVMRLLDDPVAGPVIRREMPYLDFKQLEALDVIDIHRLYYGMVTCVDDTVGKLVSHLKAAGQLDNTILVFSSDHGDLLGSHGTWRKSHVYDEAARVPFVFHWPNGLKPQKNNAHVASLMDLMPTLLALAGVEIPTTVEGRDLSSIVQGREDALEPNRVFIDAYWHKMIGVRTPTHLYAIPLEGDVEQQWQPAPEQLHWFFDMREDPFQTRNLVGTGEQDALRCELRDALLDWNSSLVHREFRQPASE